MTAAPSVSNSITVRLELPGRPTAVSELSTLIERAGSRALAGWGIADQVLPDL